MTLTSVILGTLSFCVVTLMLAWTVDACRARLADSDHRRVDEWAAWESAESWHAPSSTFPGGLGQRPLASARRASARSWDDFPA